MLFILFWLSTCTVLLDSKETILESRNQEASASANKSKVMLEPIVLAREPIFSNNAALSCHSQQILKRY